MPFLHNSHSPSIWSPTLPPSPVCSYTKYTLNLHHLSSHSLNLHFHCYVSRATAKVNESALRYHCAFRYSVCNRIYFIVCPKTSCGTIKPYTFQIIWDRICKADEHKRWHRCAPCNCAVVIKFNTGKKLHTSWRDVKSEKESSVCVCSVQFAKMELDERRDTSGREAASEKENIYTQSISKYLPKTEFRSWHFSNGNILFM